MTDDSDMDVRLGMEGSASLAAESTWPPWEVGGQGWHQDSKDPAGMGRSPLPGKRVHMWPYMRETSPARATLPPGHQYCLYLIDKADSITDVQLVVHIPDLIPQPVGRFPHQELAQVFLVKLLPPAMR